MVDGRVELLLPLQKCNTNHPHLAKSRIPHTSTENQICRWRDKNITEAVPKEVVKEEVQKHPVSRQFSLVCMLHTRRRAAWSQQPRSKEQLLEAARLLTIFLNQPNERLEDGVKAAVQQLLFQDTFSIICIRHRCSLCSEREESDNQPRPWPTEESFTFPCESYKWVQTSHGSLTLKG